MVTGMASCTGPYAVYAESFDPASVKGWVKSVADSCGLTTAFTPPALDTCLGAFAAMNFDSACGSEDERTPGVGACASTACTALVDSFTDAQVDLMVTGMASCTGSYAGYAEYADPASVKGRVKSVADSCGLTTAFTPPALD